jgi:hypothetical protein
MPEEHLINASSILANVGALLEGFAAIRLRLFQLLFWESSVKVVILMARVALISAHLQQAA